MERMPLLRYNKIIIDVTCPRGLEYEKKNYYAMRHLA